MAEDEEFRGQLSWLEREIESDMFWLNDVTNEKEKQYLLDDLITKQQDYRDIEGHFYQPVCQVYEIEFDIRDLKYLR